MVSSSLSAAAAMRRSSVLNGAFTMYLLLVLAFGYLSYHHLSRTTAPLAKPVALTSVSSSDLLKQLNEPEEEQVVHTTSQVPHPTHLRPVPTMASLEKLADPVDLDDPPAQRTGPQQEDQQAKEAKEDGDEGDEGDLELITAQPPRMTLTKSPLRLPERKKTNSDAASVPKLKPAKSQNQQDRLANRFNEDCVKFAPNDLDGDFAKHTACIPRHKVKQTLVLLVQSLVESFVHKHQMTLFLDSGTLLGAVRHQHVIPFDVNVNLVVLAKDLAYLQKTAVQLPQGMFLQVFDSRLHPKGSRTPDVPIRVVHRDTGIFADIVVFKEWSSSADTTNHKDQNQLVGPEDSSYFMHCVKCPWTRQQAGIKQFRVPKDWVFPLKNCEFAGQVVKCPNKSERYLEYMFGSGYMIPVIARTSKK